MSFVFCSMLFRFFFFCKVPHVPQVLTLTVAEEFLDVAVASQDRSSSIAYKLFLSFSLFNPFTAQACKYFWAEKCTHMPAVCFPGPIESTFSSVHFDANPFMCSAKKKT